MSNQESSLNLIKLISDTPDYDAKDALIKQNYTSLLNNTLQDLYTLQKDPLILSLIFTKHCEQKEYTKILDLTTNELIAQLMGYEKKNDFVYSKILVGLYAAIKKTNKCSELFFVFLQSNDEMDNKECIAVLTNIVVDILLKTNFILAERYFRDELCNLEQQAIHSYYKGKYYLVAGEYREAYHNLQSGMIMSNNRSFVRHLEKLFVTSMLLRSDLVFLKSYSWRKSLTHYFELYECVKSGNVHLFYELMERNKQMYKKDETFNIVMRLHKNVVKEGIRRIGICYLRAKVVDIANLLGIECKDTMILLEKGIKDGVLGGQILNDIFVNDEKNIEKLGFTEEIRDCIDTYNSVKKMMKYPKSKPLSIENIDKNSIAYDLQVL